MTGIDRLRALAGAWDDWGLGGALADIADQIERERDAELADSPYDAILPEDRDALAWVREHGGIDYVKKEWRSRVPHERYEARRQRLLGHIAECETALRRRNQRIEELEGLLKAFTNENADLRRHAMPEGCEWPTVDGRKVDFKTPYQPSLGVLEAVSIYNNGACEVMSHDGTIKPVSEIHVVVPAADGEPLEVGQTVWDVNTGDEFEVCELIQDDIVEVVVEYMNCGVAVHGRVNPETLTHQRPVLGADGVPIETCQKMWRVRNGEEVRVSQIYRGERPIIIYIGEDGLTHEITPDGLTHTKPEIDTWERVEEDADALVDAEINGEGSYNAANAYCNRRGLGEGTSFVLMAQDLVRRCRALAERERGE